MSPYTPLAREYYDTAQHPTCANFAELSLQFLEPRIKKMNEAHILEVGAGRSIVASILSEHRSNLKNLILSDLSPEMLSHSLPWTPLGARLVTFDACQTAIADDCVDVLVSSLGDAYNMDEFWHEVSRQLVSNGICLFTVPASEWADDFRPMPQRCEAEFVLKNGASISVPSYVPPLARQIAMVERCGLSVQEVQEYTVKDISGRISPKLLVNQRRASDLVVIRGFSVRKL